MLLVLRLDGDVPAGTLRIMADVEGEPIPEIIDVYAVADDTRIGHYLNDHMNQVEITRWAILDTMQARRKITELFEARSDYTSDDPSETAKHLIGYILADQGMPFVVHVNDDGTHEPVRDYRQEPE